MQPLPRWAKTFMFVALGLAAFVLVLVFVVDRTGPAQPADWRLDPAGALDPSSREVAILVNERACASGRSADGRIEVDVEYAADTVTLEVSVRPLNGDQECPSNPDTPYIVKLAEPLGDRDVMGQSSPPE
ncbi:MAG TPA: hypothetical protein VIR30_10090 [Nocardioides sp.]